MAVIGPIQPYAGGNAVQENFRAQIDHCREYNPECPVGLIKRRLNTRLRETLDRRMWGGLLVRGQIVVPAVYTTGSISVTHGSDVVTGVSTAWPTNDLVNTTLKSEIVTTNEYQDVTPASMVGINAGDWLTFDAGGDNEEFVLVVAVASTSFKAKPTLTHDADEAITKSSLARRQFRVGTTTSFYTIKGVVSATSLTIDMVWAHETYAAGTAYQIMQAYVSLEQNLRMVWSVVNNKQGWSLKLNMPQEVLNVSDTWRSGTGYSYMLVDYVPDEIGRMQYELYPSPTMQQGFPYLAYRTPGDMANDEDTPPPAIPSHVIVAGALSDILLWKRASQYYDPVTAKKFADDYERDLQAAMLADDSLFMTNLQWAYSRYPFESGVGADYKQNHDWP